MAEEKTRTGLKIGNVGGERNPECRQAREDCPALVHGNPQIPDLAEDLERKEVASKLQETVEEDESQLEFEQQECLERKLLRLEISWSERQLEFLGVEVCVGVGQKECEKSYEEEGGVTGGGRWGEPPPPQAKRFLSLKGPFLHASAV